MPGMDAFYTRDKANEGRRVDLSLPDGKPSGEWLQVRSQWSDEFRATRDASMQAVVMTAGEDLDKRRDTATERLLDVRAALVAAWSFPEPCTREAVREFLRNAPQIAERLDRWAANDADFFRSGSPDSSRGPNPKSRSGSRPPAHPSP